MKESTRRAIAFMAANRISGKNSTALYSYEESRYTYMSGNGSNAYDYEVNAHISGSGNSLISLW